MLNVLKEYYLEDKPRKFPHQLTNWLPEKKDLIPFIKPFFNHGDTDYAVIVHCPEGYALFTRGLRLQGEWNESI